MQRLKKARTAIEEGGAYVSDSDGEEEDQCPPARAPLYREDGHYWRCCEMRCVCPSSTGIGCGQ